MPGTRSSLTDPAADESWTQVRQWSIQRALELGRDEPVRESFPLGTVDAAAIADIDPAGLVQMRGSSWSLDWWVGAEDRWHYPSQDPTVTQTLRQGAPVVVTTMHVPGGNVTHTAFGAFGTSKSPEKTWEDSAVVVEIQNLSAVPVALALVVRPLGLDSDGSIEELKSEGPSVTVDGQIGAVLSRPAARRVVGAPGTIAIRLEMSDDEEPDGTWHVSGQMAEGAFVVPLPHTATLRVLLPRTDDTGLARRGNRVEVATPGPSWSAPTSEQVISGWSVHTESAAKLTTPEPILGELLSVSENIVALTSGDRFFDALGGTDLAARAENLCDFLARVGLHEPLGPIARALLGEVRLGGSIRMPDRSDASVALIHAAAPLLAGPNSARWAEDLIGPVARAIHRVERGKVLSASRSAQPSSTDWLSARSAATAIARVAPAMRSVGQPDVAIAAAELSAKLWSHVGHSPSVTALATSVDTDQTPGDTIGRIAALRHLVSNGDERAIPELVNLARMGRLGTLAPSYDSSAPSKSSDPALVAARAATVLDALVRDGPAGPLLMSSWDEHWFEKPIEVKSVCLAWGVVSFAVRWHGNQPALLWEIDPAEGFPTNSPGPVLTAPGLDPAWSGSGWSGEAILSPIEVSETVKAEIAERSKPTTPVQLGVKPPKRGR